MESEELQGSRKKPMRRLTPLDLSLGELLGAGSYGSVYRARRADAPPPDRRADADAAPPDPPSSHDDLAVKVLPWTPSEVSHELKKELRLLQSCDDPHIVRAHGMFLKPRELWIVMEFCEYGSLLDVMRSMRSALPEEAIAAACADALRGLRYLHSQRRAIIHRDVKCANLLLAASGVVKLADFGVAAQLNSTASKRSSVIGTPHWMAPEVVQSGRYDARADVWSLAVTAIEMAQARPPLANLRPVLKVMFAIAAGEPVKLDHPARFSALLNAFLDAALVKDPLLRPSSEAILRHPFVRTARRPALAALVRAAQEARDHPPPAARSERTSACSDATLTRDADPATRDAVDSSRLSRGSSGGGRDSCGDAAQGTVVVHATEVPTLPAPRGGAAGAPPRQPSCVDPDGACFYTASGLTLDDSATLELSRARAAQGAPPLARALSDDALYERPLEQRGGTGSSGEGARRAGLWDRVVEAASGALAQLTQAAPAAEARAGGAAHEQCIVC